METYVILEITLIYHTIPCSYNDSNFGESLQVKSNFMTWNRGIHTSTSYKWNNTWRTKCILRYLSQLSLRNIDRSFFPTSAYAFISQAYHTLSYMYRVLIVITPSPIMILRSSLCRADNLKLAAGKKGPEKTCIPLSHRNVSIRFYLRCGRWFIVRSGSRIRATIFPRTNLYGSVYREIYRSFQCTVDATEGGGRGGCRRVPPAGFYRGHRAV